MQRRGVPGDLYRAPAGGILRLTLITVCATVAASLILGGPDNRFVLSSLLAIVLCELVGSGLVWANTHQVGAARLKVDETAPAVPNIPPFAFAMLAASPALVIAAVSALGGGDPNAARILGLVAVANAGTGLMIGLFSVRPAEGVRVHDQATERRQKLIGVAIGVGIAVVGGDITILIDP